MTSTFILNSFFWSAGAGIIKDAFERRNVLFHGRKTKTPEKFRHLTDGVKVSLNNNTAFIKKRIEVPALEIWFTK